MYVSCANAIELRSHLLPMAMPGIGYRQVKKRAELEIKLIRAGSLPAVDESWDSWMEKEDIQTYLELVRADLLSDKENSGCKDAREVLIKMVESGSFPDDEWMDQNNTIQASFDLLEKELTQTAGGVSPATVYGRPLSDEDEGENEEAAPKLQVAALTNQLVAPLPLQSTSPAQRTVRAQAHPCPI